MDKIETSTLRQGPWPKTVPWDHYIKWLDANWEMFQGSEQIAREIARREEVEERGDQVNEDMRVRLADGKVVYIEIWFDPSWEIFTFAEAKEMHEKFGKALRLCAQLTSKGEASDVEVAQVVFVVSVACPTTTAASRDA